jgi:hypothetical protein
MPPATGVGPAASAAAPIPSSPDGLRPQQYASSPVDTPQTCSGPSATERKVIPGPTGVGTETTGEPVYVV